jgi:hypothetical protein
VRRNKTDRADVDALLEATRCGDVLFLNLPLALLGGPCACTTSRWSRQRWASFLARSPSFTFDVSAADALVR